VKAVTAAGVDVSRIEIDRTGKITIIAANGSAKPTNDLDQELVEWEARHGQG
jgi:hypothetical protein